MSGSPEQKSLGSNLYVWLWLISLFAFLLLLTVTSRWGIGISPDSLVYLRTADEIRHGTRVLFSDNAYDPNLLSAHYPPLYPAAITVVNYIFNAELAPRILQAFLFGVNAFLVGLCVRTIVRDSLLPPIGCSCFFVFSEISLNLHSMALSEPQFICFSLVGLIFLNSFIQSDKWYFLLLSAACFSLSFFTRYTGAVSIFTGFLFILFFYRKPTGKRLATVAAFMAVSTIPVALWLSRNYLVFGRLTSREFQVHLPGLDKAHEFLATIVYWFLPVSKCPMLLSFLFFLIIIAMSLFVMPPLFSTKTRGCPPWRECLNHLPPLFLMISIYVPLYLLFLAVSVSFFDAYTPLNYRLLFPVYTLLIILLPGMFSAFREEIRARQKLVVLFALLLLGSYVFRAIYRSVQTYRNGQGYASKQWKDQNDLREIGKLPDSSVIYSNAPQILNYLSRRKIRNIPARINPLTNRDNPQFDSFMIHIKADLDTKGGFFIYLKNVNRPSLPDLQTLKSRLDLRTTYNGKTCEILSPR